MLDPTLLSFVRGSLPSPPVRVLEVGAGEGELAAALRSDGYDVVAIDPAAKEPEVQPVRLHELDGPESTFDAAVAVLSMHHVEPLEESCRRLGELVKPEGALVLDEIDFARFDERAARWWLEQHRAVNGDGDKHASSSPSDIVADLRRHCHILADVEAALAEWFELSAPTRGPYLYRWELSPALRDTELGLIAEGSLPATGATILGRRRPK